MSKYHPWIISGIAKHAFGRKNKIKIPCCAKWHKASSIWRLMGAASLFAFLITHGSAPSSINRDLLIVFPKIILLNISIISQNPFQPIKYIIYYFITLSGSSRLALGKISYSTCNLCKDIGVTTLNHPK